MNRKYGALYEASTGQWRVIFRDDYDSPDQWYVLTGADSEEACRAVVEALNAQEDQK